jgi:hypothetical protein
VAVGRGNAHRHPRDPGDLGRDRVHQDRAGIGREPARHVEADRVERRPAGTEAHAGSVDEIDPGRRLPLVERADPVGGDAQRGKEIGRAGGLGRRDLGVGHAQRRGRHVGPIEAAGQFHHRRIAPGPDVGEDRGGGGVDVGAGLALGVEEPCEGIAETGIGGGQPMRHGPPHGTGRSSPTSRPAAS